MAHNLEPRELLGAFGGVCPALGLDYLGKREAAGVLVQVVHLSAIVHKNVDAHVHNLSGLVAVELADACLELFPKLIPVILMGGRDESGPITLDFLVVARQLVGELGSTVVELGLGCLFGSKDDSLDVAHGVAEAQSSRAGAVDDHQVLGVAGRRPCAAGPVPNKRLLAGFSGDVPQRLGVNVGGVDAGEVDVELAFLGDVEVLDAVRHGVSARGQRGPHRRSDGGHAAQKLEVVTSRAALDELLGVGHVALIHHDAREFGVEAVDAQKQYLFGKTLRSKHVKPSLSYKLCPICNRCAGPPEPTHR